MPNLALPDHNKSRSCIFERCRQSHAGSNTAIDCRRCTSGIESTMAPRTSNRSSVTRDHASSPPKNRRIRQSQSPVGRRTRSTRSASAELGDNDTGVSAMRGGKRGIRQTSVESVESSTSAASSDRGGRRKASRTAAAARGRYILSA